MNHPKQGALLNYFGEWWELAETIARVANDFLRRTSTLGSLILNINSRVIYTLWLSYINHLVPCFKQL